MKLKIKLISLIYIANMYMSPSLQAMDDGAEPASAASSSSAPTLQALDDIDLERIESTYGLNATIYSEDLKEHFQAASQVIFETLANLNGKKFGIVVGENHNLEGAKCFEMLLIKLAESTGIRHCLVELTPEKLEIVIRDGYKMGGQSGFLQRLIKEAQRAKMKAIPIDIGLEKQNSEGLEEIKELYFTGKKREENFINKILLLNESFVFFTGANHLSSLYYDPRLNDKFSLLFFNCGLPMSQEDKEIHDRINKRIDDPGFSEIYAQMQKFLTETDRSYQTLVRYNAEHSRRYKRMMDRGDPLFALSGIEAKEIRANHTDEATSSDCDEN